ncbi:MAG: ATP-binding protein [Clostridia bacterium]|nr:ATP-binding protein [Clostridia bacterium]
MKDLSLHLIDIIQNSISAKAKNITISLNACTESDNLKIEVADNGVGMDEELLSQVTNPFVTTRTTRKVGLGISLLKASAESTGGSLAVTSVKGEGTTLVADFKIKHIDRLPLGDIGETMVSAILTEPDINFELNLFSNKDSFKFSSFEIKDKLGEVPITQLDIITWIREFINEGVKITFGGVLDEIIS